MKMYRDEFGTADIVGGIAELEIFNIIIGIGNVSVRSGSRSCEAVMIGWGIRVLSQVDNIRRSAASFPKRHSVTLFCKSVEY